MSLTFDVKLGKVLRDRRIEKKYTQEYVADQLGVSKNQVSHWELGKRSMYAESLEEYCKVLNVPMQKVFEEMRT